MLWCASLEAVVSRNAGGCDDTVEKDDGAGIRCRCVSRDRSSAVVSKQPSKREH